MINQKILWLNLGIVGITIGFALAGSILWLKRPSEIVSEEFSLQECRLPKSAFELTAQDYEQMGNPLLVLQEMPLALQLPDLRTQVVYYGKNGRPDGQSKNTLLHFACAGGNKSIVSMAPHEKIYLIYDRRCNPPRYAFSHENEKTSLWFEAEPVDAEVQLSVTLENDRSEKVTEPEGYATFRLPEKEFVRFGGAAWEIGTFRVDGTLLARQRARWYGIDRFLEDHGGDEYKNIEGKQRIDFGENTELYSVFVKVGDCLIWDQQNRWKVTEPGVDSQGHPLLVVKKIDDRLMTFELWDIEGRGKIALNLLRSTEPWTVQNTQTLQNIFKFVGARTRTQCVFEINGERITLKPSDWLLLTPKGWKKLATEEEIDQYVRRNISGTLFVFEGLVRKDERQMMKGKIYSSARNEYQAVELALQTRAKTVHSRELKDVREGKSGVENGESEAAAPVRDHDRESHVKPNVHK